MDQQGSAGRSAGRSAGISRDQQVDVSAVAESGKLRLAGTPGKKSGLEWRPGREYAGQERIRMNDKGKAGIAPLPLQANAVGSWGKGVDKADRMRRLDQLDKTVKEAIKAQDRSFDLQQHIPELWQIGSQSAKTCSACAREIFDKILRPNILAL